MAQYSVAWKSVLGKYGVGNCNDNWYLILEFYTGDQLIITNTILPKSVWKQSGFIHSLNISLSMFWCDSRIWKTSCMSVMPSSEYYTDYRLVCCKLKVHFKPKQRKKRVFRKSSRLEVFSQMKGKLVSRQPFSYGLKIQASLRIPLLKYFKENLRLTFCKHPWKSSKIKDWFDVINVKIKDLLGKKIST